MVAEPEETAGGPTDAPLRVAQRSILADDVYGIIRDGLITRRIAPGSRLNLDHLARELNARRVIRIPYMDEDIHDLEGLLKIDRYLFATEEQREALAASGAA